MKKGLWHKRIPNLAAFGLLLVGLWVSLLFIQTGVFYVGQAGPNKVPQGVTISNVTDTSFTVSFTTNEKTLSGLEVEEENSSPYLVYDDRNKISNQQNQFFSHFITVSELKPNTTYKFTVLADSEKYLNSGQKYTVKTGLPIAEAPPAQTPIVGSIILTDGAKGQDVIVDLSISGAQKITVLTKEDGQFIIPTNSIRDSSLENYFILNGEQEITITAKRQNTKSTVISLYSESANIPTITLEESYNFTAITKEEVATLSSQLQVPTPRIGIGEVRITTPREGQTFVDPRPQFRGTALARQIVKIKYDNRSLETTSDGNGIWVLRPEIDVPPGEHTLTIESPDRFGIIKSVSENFTVFSSGSQVSQSATPSATPTLTLAPTATPTRTPTLSPTVKPTSTPTTTPALSITPSPTSIITTPTLIEKPTSPPTATIAPTATAQPTSTMAVSPTKVPSISPPAPGSASAITLTFVSVFLIFAGGALLFLL